MEQTIASHQQRPRPSRLARLTVGIIFSGIVLVICLALSLWTGIGLVMFYPDAAPPDDSWLLPKPYPAVHGPGSIQEFAEEFGHPLELEKAERLKLPEDVRQVTFQSAAKARFFVDWNHALLDDFNHLLAAHPEPLRFPGGSEGMTADSDVRYLSALQEGAVLAAMYAKVLAQEGKLRESVEQSMALMRLARQLSHEGSGMIQWVLAISIQTIGMRTMEYAANQGPWDEETMASVEKQLPGLEMTVGDFRFPMQGEYQMFKHELRVMELANQAHPLQFSDSENWWRHTLKPNATRAMVLDQFRPPFLSCEKDWHACWMISRQYTLAQDDLNQHRLLHLLNTNAAGHILAHFFMFNLEKICEKSMLGVALQRQVPVMFALRRFEIEHQAPPQKLDELCPRYLPTVPLDPFNNQPMHWNPATMALYSVGADLKDDGGAFSRPYSGKDKDVGMTYWWASQPK